MIDIDKPKVLSSTELRFHRNTADERLAAITERLDKKRVLNIHVYRIIITTGFRYTFQKIPNS